MYISLTHESTLTWQRLQITYRRVDASVWWLLKSLSDGTIHHNHAFNLLGILILNFSRYRVSCINSLESQIGGTRNYCSNSHNSSMLNVMFQFFPIQAISQLCPPKSNQTKTSNWAHVYSFKTPSSQICPNNSKSELKPQKMTKLQIN